MDARRIVAAIAALAVGIGVTLVGVVFADDGADDGANDPVGTELAADAEVRQDQVDVESPDEADVSEVVPTVEPSPPETTATPDPTATPDANEVPDEAKPDTTTIVSDVESVECVDTVAVGYVDGQRGDYVVVENLGDSSYLVLDADGQFEISALDPNVEELLLVARNVRFFQGAAVNFLDVCTDLGGDEGGIGGDIESFGVASSRLPHLDQKRAR